jgi:ribosomal-protein-alanine N-acetyltransferase
MAEAQDELAYWINLYHQRAGIYWAIATRDTNKMIGAIGLHDLNRHNNRAEISYDLSPDYWGKGIMTKTTNKVLEYAFTGLNINRIQASTVKENTPSIKLLKRCKFRKDGTLRKYRYHNGQYYDIEMYAILEEDFFSKKNKQAKEKNFIKKIFKK